jgi:hypothetical protein
MQGDFMLIRNDRSTGKPMTRDDHGDLLYYRMAMLGLDLCAIEIESGDSEMFDKFKRSCARCDFREACAIDLKHNPNNPAWEDYCPNSGPLSALMQAWCLTH